MMIAGAMDAEAQPMSFAEVLNLIVVWGTHSLIPIMTGHTMVVGEDVGGTIITQGTIEGMMTMVVEGETVIKRHKLLEGEIREITVNYMKTIRGIVSVEDKCYFWPPSEHWHCILLEAIMGWIDQVLQAHVHELDKKSKFF